MLATHRLAQLNSQGKGVPRSCLSAVHGFKQVAERGDMATAMTEAYRRYEAGDSIGALRIFAIYASMGFGVAQVEI